MKKITILVFFVLATKWVSAQCNFEQDSTFNNGEQFIYSPDITYTYTSGYTGQWLSYEMNDLTVLPDGTIHGIGFRREQEYPGDNILTQDDILYRFDNMGNLLGISSFSGTCSGGGCGNQKIVTSTDGNFLAIANNQLYCGDVSTSCLNASWLGDVHTVLVQPDGKILFATYSDLFRYNDDISEDLAFNNNVNTVSIPPNQDIDLLPNGKIILTGDNQIIRLNSDGAMDTSFGNSGSVSILTGTRTNIAIQSTQKMVVLDYDYATDEAVAYRLNADGTIDNTFTNNTVYTGLGLWCDFNMITLPTDDILTSGNCGDSDLLFGYISNLAADGTNISPINNNIYTTAIALHPDGSLVAGGDFYYPGYFPWGASYSAWINLYQCNLPVYTESPDLKDFSLTVFPIPAKERLHIDFQSKKQNLTLSINGIDGRILHRETINTTIGLNSKALDLSTLLQGVYILTINDGEQIKSKRFIKE